MDTDKAVSGRTGKVIVLEGIDGTGKSTIARRITERMRDGSVVHTTYKDIAPTPPELETAMQQLKAILWPATQHHLKILPSQYRVLLHAAWVNLVSEGVVAPHLANSKSVVFDGWCYKLMARFLVDGYSRDYVETVFSHVTKPDHVIVLQIDARSVWTRAMQTGRKFSPVEMGLYQGHATLGEDTYVSYQSRTHDALLLLARDSAGDVIVVDANRAIDETTDEIEHIMRGLLGSSSR